LLYKDGRKGNDAKFCEICLFFLFGLLGNVFVSEYIFLCYIGSSGNICFHCKKPNTRENFFHFTSILLLFCYLLTSVFSSTPWVNTGLKEQGD